MTYIETMKPAIGWRPCRVFGAAALILVLLTLVWTGWAGAVVLDVAPDGSGTYADLQQALLAAQAGDTLRLADGTFTGPGNRNLVLGGTVTLRSATGDPDACILDLQQQGRAFQIYSGPGTSVYIEGITVRDGDCRSLDEPAAPGYGGAVYVEGLAPGGTVAFSDCVFAGNRAEGGGAAFIYHSGATFVNCVFEGNLATDGAGAYCGFCDGYGDLAFTGCMFSGNVYPELSVGGYGSGLYFSHATGAVTDCTFADNRAWVGAGILVSTDAVVNMSRTIIAFNPEGPGLSLNNGMAVITCSNIFGNAGGDWTGGIADQFAEPCNLSADPLFCDLAGGDLSLRADSPCLAANNGGCGDMGARPLGCPVAGVEVGDLNGVALAAVPNPFNARTVLSFDLPAASVVSLRVYDLSGRLAAVLLDRQPALAGRNDVTWSGIDDAGRALPSGTYVYRLEAGDIAVTRAVTLLK